MGQQQPAFPQIQNSGSPSRIIDIEAAVGVDGLTSVTTAGTEVPLVAAASVIAAQALGTIVGLYVSARSSNTNAVVIGRSASVVAAAATQAGGIVLKPPHSPFFIPTQRPDLLWLDAITNGEGVAWSIVLA